MESELIRRHNDVSHPIQSDLSYTISQTHPRKGHSPFRELWNECAAPSLAADMANNYKKLI